jgi:hypothetical protein
MLVWRWEHRSARRSKGQDVRSFSVKNDFSIQIIFPLDANNEAIPSDPPGPWALADQHPLLHHLHHGGSWHYTVRSTMSVPVELLTAFRKF